MSNTQSDHASAELPWEQSGYACAWVLPDGFRLHAVTDRYLQFLQTSRGAALGSCLPALWMPRPTTPRALESPLPSLQHALASRLPALRAFPVETSPGHIATLMQRTTPIVDAAGDVRHLVHALEGPFELDEGTAAMLGAIERTTRWSTLELERTSERLLRETAEHLKTERALRRSEEQLRQAQKLDALGRLAGGIAHDFNNLLSVILGYSSSLVVENGVTSSARRQIVEIRSAAERAAELTLQLLAFSRGQVLEPKVVNLNLSMLRLEKMLRRLLGEDIDLRLLLEPALGRVRVDPSQIEQVIMNLVINARDAMPTGGSLTIETSNVELDAAYAHEHLGTDPGAYVVLCVSDSGTGMDKSTQARIFEPFFTTKEPGKGTGLGLSTAFGIIRQSGGSIWVYSEPGTGTTFKVYLPRVPAERASLHTAEESAELPKGSELVLVVEDERQVSKLTCDMLRRAGYEVIEALDPEDALRWAESSERKPDLLLTDVVMPKMSGRVLAGQMATKVPSVRILFMSGYTDDAVLRHGILDSKAAFLQKPLTPEKLTRKVREVLDAPRG